MTPSFVVGRTTMVNLNGKEIWTVTDIVKEFRDRAHVYPGTYVLRYRFGLGGDMYDGTRMERPAAWKMHADGAYPWETVLIAAANCAGSDYPMLADHFGVPLDGIDIEVQADFDPRPEFVGLDPSFPPTPALQHSLREIRWKATLHSSAPEADLRRVHERVLSHNMVLDALRAVPIKGELVVARPTLAAGAKR